MFSYLQPLQDLNGRARDRLHRDCRLVPLSIGGGEVLTKTTSNFTPNTIKKAQYLFMVAYLEVQRHEGGRLVEVGRGDGVGRALVAPN